MLVLLEVLIHQSLRGRRSLFTEVVPWQVNFRVRKAPTLINRRDVHLVIEGNKRCSPEYYFESWPEHTKGTVCTFINLYVFVLLRRPIVFVLFLRLEPGSRRQFFSIGVKLSNQCVNLDSGMRGKKQEVMWFLANTSAYCLKPYRSNEPYFCLVMIISSFQATENQKHGWPNWFPRFVLLNGIHLCGPSEVHWLW